MSTAVKSIGYHCSTHHLMWIY